MEETAKNKQSNQCRGLTIDFVLENNLSRRNNKRTDDDDGGGGGDDDCDVEEKVVLSNGYRNLIGAVMIQAGIYIIHNIHSTHPQTERDPLVVGAVTADMHTITADNEIDWICKRKDHSDPEVDGAIDVSVTRSYSYENMYSFFTPECTKERIDYTERARICSGCAQSKKKLIQRLKIESHSLIDGPFDQEEAVKDVIRKVSLNLIQTKLQSQRQRQNEQNIEVVDEKSDPFESIISANLIGQVLSYIDRMDWNLLVLCKKNIYYAAKPYLPPWPKSCELKLGPFSYLHDPTWSPDGTKVACCEGGRIHIFDQRRGLLRDSTGWVAHEDWIVSSLLFSHNGRLLCSGGGDGYVRLWDHATGNYELLQEWNVRQEGSYDDIDEESSIRIAISPCDKYMAVLQDHSILLKDIRDGGPTIKSLMIPGARCGSNVLFSNDGHTILFGGEKEDRDIIKLWRPLDGGGVITVNVDADDDQTNVSFIQNLALSRDGTKLASTSHLTEDVRLWVIDKETGGLNLEATFKGNKGFVSAVSFTPDDKYVVVGAGVGAGVGADAEEYSIGRKFWRIEDGIPTRKKSSNGTVSTLNYSPDGQRLLIEDDWGVFIVTEDSDDGEDDGKRKDLFHYQRQHDLAFANYQRLRIGLMFGGALDENHEKDISFWQQQRESAAANIMRLHGLGNRHIEESYEKTDNYVW